MRARRPTSAMPKPCLCCERAFLCSMVVMWPVLMSRSCLWGEMKKCGWLWGDTLLWLVGTWHVMSCHLMWWSRHLMRCDCLCCVMSPDATRCHGDKPLSVVPCNGKECYELKMPTPVLLCTTKYYSSTTLYYKVLLHSYSVLQSTTPYYFETSFTLSGATRVTLHHQQILHLPRKTNRVIDPQDMWNVIYTARSKWNHPSNSPKTAPASKFWIQDVRGKSLE